MAGFKESKPKRRLKGLRPATGRQLFRLNEQGLLRVVLVEDAFVPGGPPEGWTFITHADAAPLLDRCRAERWVGLGRFPEPGESWTVRDGLVIPTGRTVDDDV